LGLAVKDSKGLANLELESNVAIISHIAILAVEQFLVSFKNSQPNLSANRDSWTSPWRRLAFFKCSAGVSAAGTPVCVLAQ